MYDERVFTVETFCSGTVAHIGYLDCVKWRDCHVPNFREILWAEPGTDLCVHCSTVTEMT